MEELKLFYSYSHKDEKFRQTLETNLKLMTRNGMLVTWHDRKITAGTEWRKKIEDEIKSADIILLLISSDFIASDFCYENEMELAMKLHDSKQSIVIPVLLRACGWKKNPFSELQALPRDANPISLWRDEDEAWLDVVTGLENAIDEINKRKLRKVSKNEFHRINGLLKSEVLQIDSRFRIPTDGDRSIGGISSGFSDYDRHMDGLRAKEMTVVSSRSESARSCFALQIAGYISIHEKKPVGYFSLNSSAERITRKLITSEAKIFDEVIAKALLDEHQWPSLSMAVGRMKDSPIFIHDSPTLTLDHIRDGINES